MGINDSTNPVSAFEGLTSVDFCEKFGGVYEGSPWVAESVWGGVASGEVSSPQEIKAAMRESVNAASREKLLELMRAHPELACKATDRLTADSKSEQSGAGLDQCTPEEFDEFSWLNTRYREKFGFPFIIAVSGLDKREILKAFRRRCDNAADKEFKSALEEIHKIAEIRLSRIFSTTK